MNHYDVLIPCYNEEKHLSQLLAVITTSPYVAQCIVVDDGSIDNSAMVARKYKNVTLIKLPNNEGKGSALRAGLEQVTTPAVLLFDADLYGLRSEHITMMVQTYERHPDGLVIGLTDKSNSAQNWLRENVLPLISGQRMLSTNNLRQVLKETLSNGYGIEPYMNYYFRKHHTTILTLSGVNDIPKYRKELHGLKPHMAEGIELLGKYIQIYGSRMPLDIYEEVKEAAAVFLNKP